MFKRCPQGLTVKFGRSCWSRPITLASSGLRWNLHTLQPWPGPMWGSSASKGIFVTLPQERLNPANEMPRRSDRFMFTMIHALWTQNTTNAVFFCSSVHQCTVVWVCFACSCCLCHSVHPLPLPRHVCSIRRCTCGGVARGQNRIHSML